MKRKFTEFTEFIEFNNKFNKLDNSNKRKNIENNIDYDITKKIKPNLKIKPDMSNKRKNIIEHDIIKKIKVDLEENVDMYLDMDFNNINIIDNDYINSYIK
jgi:hypothetical protein